MARKCSKRSEDLEEEKAYKEKAEIVSHY